MKKRMQNKRNNTKIMYKKVTVIINICTVIITPINMGIFFIKITYFFYFAYKADVVALKYSINTKNAGFLVRAHKPIKLNHLQHRSRISLLLKLDFYFHFHNHIAH